MPSNHKNLTMKKNLYKPIRSQVFPLAFSILLLVSCQKSVLEIPEEQEKTTKTPVATSPLTNQVDIEFFSRLGQLASVSDLVWKGYKMEKMPMYFIYTNFAGDPIRAYVINPRGGSPEANLEGIKKITGTPFEAIYRYDGEMEDALVSINQINQFFDFDYELNDGRKYYIQVYENDNRLGNNDLKEFTNMATHEVFHAYQFKNYVSIYDASTPVNNTGNFGREYVLSKPILSAQIATLELAQKIQDENDPEVLSTYLKTFIAIRSEEISINSSNTNDTYLLDLANLQENREGSAKYVEYISQIKGPADIDSKKLVNFTTMDLKKYFTTSGLAKGYFNFGIWYDTGSAFIHALDKLNQIPLLKQKILKESKSPYAIAKAHFKLSSKEMEIILQEARGLLDWEMINSETDRIFPLLTK